MITYRVQDKSRSLTDLLDPAQQLSFPMGGDDELVRHGVSGMASISDLAAYIAVMAIEASRPVLVRIDGPVSDDEPCDADMGEVLTLPETAEVVEDDEAFFALVSDMVDLHWERGAEYDQLRTIAADRI